MYVVREIMQCKPGKVREIVFAPFHVLTDVSGEPFWTVVAETEVERLDEFVAMEAKVMANQDARRAMDGYHDLVERGRREIYKREN